jgi:hypothetical protein
MNIFNLFKRSEITQAEIDAEIKVIKAEQRYRRKYITPPPLVMWSMPISDKKGFFKSMGPIETNQEYRDRWEKEHFDWLSDNED